MIRRFACFIFVLSLTLILGCTEDSGAGGDNNNALIPIIDGGVIAPGSGAVIPNPRYPGLKTYSNINSGFYSIP
jgi:hypothetical protein